MNKHFSTKLARIVALCFVTVLFAISASAQIRIGNIEIKTPKNPQPNKPPTTNSNGNKIPNPNGNKTPTSTSNTNVETGATDEQVRAFNKDMEPYRNGIQQLMYMARSKASNPSCRELPSVRKALTDGAAFLEIITQFFAISSRFSAQRRTSPTV